MGNTLSGNLSKNEDKLLEELNTIASELILTKDFGSLKKLFSVKYCDRLELLTATILDEKFDHKEIGSLYKNLKIREPGEPPSGKKFKYDPQKKLKLCRNIASFYVLIANFYAAIMSTINPVYSFKDKNNLSHKVGILDEKNILPFFPT